MATDTDRLRTALAGIILAGDFQELMNLYAGGDVAPEPEEVIGLHQLEALAPDDAAALEEVRGAIPDDLLPSLDQRVTVPAEMVELAARFALERGDFVQAVRALREAGSLDRLYTAHADFALGSLQAGDEARAAYELTLAGRLGWARMSLEQRLEFLLGLGVDPGELASSLGGESARGKVSARRELPDFPAWQTYGMLLHARCQVAGCIADADIDRTAPLAVRFLLHDAELAERAIEASGDALRLLRALAAQTDPDLAEYADRYKEATKRYRELQEQRLVRDSRAESAPAEQPAEPSADSQAEEPEASAEEEAPAKAEATDEPGPDEEASDKLDAVQEGLEEVQSLLLGRREKRWRNCLAELSASHPLSVFTVCTVRGYELDGFVIPAGDAATRFLDAVLA